MLKLQRGETILIQGGAGGVAGFAIQLAKHIGARVITTANASRHASVRALGADQLSITTFVISRGLLPIVTLFSTRSGAMRRSDLSRCSSQAAERLSSPPAHRRRGQNVPM
jgi:hypothetical protein